MKLYEDFAYLPYSSPPALCSEILRVRFVRVVRMIPLAESVTVFLNMLFFVIVRQFCWKLNSVIMTKRISL